MTVVYRLHLFSPSLCVSHYIGKPYLTYYKLIVLWHTQPSVWQFNSENETPVNSSIRGLCPFSACWPTRLFLHGRRIPEVLCVNECDLQLVNQSIKLLSVSRSSASLRAHINSCCHTAYWVCFPQMLFSSSRHLCPFITITSLQCHWYVQTPGLWEICKAYKR